MRRAVVVSALLALAAAGVSGAGDPAWGSLKSKLVAEPSSVDVGKVRAGEDAVATFTLHNPTAREIRILAAHPS